MVLPSHTFHTVAQTAARPQLRQQRLCSAYVAKNTKFCGYGVQKHRRCVEDTPELRRGTCGGARQRSSLYTGSRVLQAWSSGAAAGNRRPSPPRAPSVGSQDRSQASQLFQSLRAGTGACPEALEVCAPGRPQRLGTSDRSRWRPQPASGTLMVVVPQLAVSPVLASRSPPMPTLHGGHIVLPTRGRPLREPDVCQKSPEARQRSIQHRPGPWPGRCR